MTRPKQLQLQLLLHLLEFPLQLLLVLCTLLQLICCSAALPQDILIDATGAQLEQSPTSPALNVPSGEFALLSIYRYISHPPWFPCRSQHWTQSGAREQPDRCRRQRRTTCSGSIRSHRHEQRSVRPPDGASKLFKFNLIFFFCFVC